MPGGALVVLSCCGAIRTELVATWEWCELFSKLQDWCESCAFYSPGFVLPSLATSGVGIRGLLLATFTFKPFNLESENKK